MSTRRFKPNTYNSLFGQPLYEQVIPENHFLVKLKEVVPWQRYSYKLLKYYKGHGQLGRPPYDPVVVLKMLLLSYVYDVSERQVEDFCNFYLPAKYFLALGVNEKAPDHSTLTTFKERILENGKLAAYEKLLQDIVSLAQEKGVVLGSIQIVDSTHSLANVNVEKDKKRQSQGKPPRDGSARWGVKRSYKVKDEQGRKQEQKEYFYGYKMHASVNAETGLITSLAHSSGNRPDGEYFCRLVQSDLAQGLPVDTYSGDQAYDDSELHVFLQSHNLHDALKLHKYRTNKKDEHKDIWLALQESETYKQGLKQRYKIERKFGEAKREHGLGRCRYVGLIRYAIQGFLTAIVLNLKRLVCLLTRVPFKGRAMVLA